MTDTLILFKPLADFGEALKKDCPKNDCTSYLYTYEQYCAVYADYKRIKETIADLSEATVRVLEHAIRKTEAELYKMWFENYAVLKQRAARDFLRVSFMTSAIVTATKADKPFTVVRVYGRY